MASFPLGKQKPRAIAPTRISGSASLLPSSAARASSRKRSPSASVVLISTIRHPSFLQEASCLKNSRRLASSTMKSPAPKEAKGIGSKAAFPVPVVTSSVNGAELTTTRRQRGSSDGRGCSGDASHPTSITRSSGPTYPCRGMLALSVSPVWISHASTSPTEVWVSRSNSRIEEIPSSSNSSRQGIDRCHEKRSRIPPRSANSPRRMTCATRSYPASVRRVTTAPGDPFQPRGSDRRPPVRS